MYIQKAWERSRALVLACLAKYGAARVVLFATVQPMGFTSIIYKEDMTVSDVTCQRMKAAKWLVAACLIIPSVSSEAAYDPLTNGVARTGTVATMGAVNTYSIRCINASGTAYSPLYDLVVQTTLGSLPDSVLKVSGGAFTAIDDNGGGGRSSKVVATVRDGSYTAYVSAFAANQTGTYTVKATWKPTPITAIPATGAWIAGNIEEPRVSDWYKFSPDGLHQYTIETSLGTLPDSVVELYRWPDIVNYIGYNDDNGASYASKLVIVPPAESYYGTDYLRVRAKGTTQKGTYSVRMTRKCILPAGITPLQYEAPAMNACIETAGSHDWFAFSVPKAKSYTVQLRQGAAPAVASVSRALYGPNSQTKLIYQFNGFTSSMPKYLQPGIYYVKVQGLSTYKGNYTIRLTY